MLRGGGYSHTEILDEMQLWEAELALSSLSYQAPALQNLLRLTAWAGVAPYSKEQLEPSDLYVLPWEEEQDEADGLEDRIEQAKARLLAYNRETNGNSK